MKAGDLVRFRKNKAPRKSTNDWIWEWKIGLLVEYHSWEKIATILYGGLLIRVSATDVTNAGRKDRAAIDESR